MARSMTSPSCSWCRRRAVAGARLDAASTARLRVPAPVVFLIAAAAISDIRPALSEPVSIRDVARIGVVALIAILFDGGVEIGWRRCGRRFGRSSCWASWARS